MNILNQLTQAVDLVTEEHAPLDTDGAQPSHGSFNKEVSKTLELWSNPAVKPSDLVRPFTLQYPPRFPGLIIRILFQPKFWDALKNGNTIGLDDRKLLAGVSLCHG
jgi:linoleate 10R-lipoxygenase